MFLALVLDRYLGINLFLNLGLGVCLWLTLGLGLNVILGLDMRLSICLRKPHELKTNHQIICLQDICNEV